MSDWSRKLLEQHGAMASALKNIERINNFTQSVAEASIAAEYNRVSILNAAQNKIAELHSLNAYQNLDRFSSLSEVSRIHDASRHYWSMFPSSVVDQVRSAAQLAQTYDLHGSLSAHRTPVDSFTSKLLNLQALDTIKSPTYLNAFMQASTMSDIFAESMRVDRQLLEASNQFSKMAVPTFGTLNSYRQFLDASGLVLSHWPNVRLLTIGEKRRRFRDRLNSNAEPVHVKKARTLVQRYELTLREILIEVMEGEYGEDWAVERLPLCDCKDLLGKWQKRGGEVLNHADYAHYARIMSYPEHFDAVFEAGFDNPIAISELIEKAGKLRAALQHFHPFTSEDLRDLRLAWRSIETGLLALIEDYDIGSWQ